jgi:hypothetical protein
MNLPNLHSARAAIRDNPARLVKDRRHTCGRSDMLSVCMPEIGNDYRFGRST